MSTFLNLAVKLLHGLASTSSKPSTHRTAQGTASALPHPEEPVDNSRTMTNSRIEPVLQKWLLSWNVPLQYHSYWLKECQIILSEKYPAAASTISQTKQVFVRPEWANPGVIAHEACHIVWFYLPEGMKNSFGDDLNAALQTDKLLQLAWQTKPYMQTNMIEAHADVYRYIGHLMPETLKKYYPKLLV